MAELIVRAGVHKRVFVPVSVKLEAPLPENPWVEDLVTGTRIPAQVEETEEGPVLHFILPYLGRGESAKYSIVEGDKVKGVVMQEGEASLDVYLGGVHFTSYNFGDVVRPYLYPLVGPDGVNMTRHYPMKEIEGETRDHIHHRSIWTAYGDVNGVDNWLEEGEHGGTKHKGFVKIVSGPVYGEFVAEGEWVDKDGRKILEEMRRVRFYNLPGDLRLFDYEVELIASEGDVKFGDTKEGGILSVRVATNMDVDRGGQIQNAFGGINEAETWGKPAHWCDYSGPFSDGLWRGIAVFDHPENFRHPTQWHVRNYGLMTANPFAWSYYYPHKGMRGDYLLKSGEKLRFLYRVYIHRGDAEEADVGEHYHSFINPPEVILA